jgi:hypothetical protein
MSDPVDNPAHYTGSKATCACGLPIECIQITRHLNFNMGNAVKYIWRADSKGKPVEDLKKAMWYLADEIKRRENP